MPEEFAGVSVMPVTYIKARNTNLYTYFPESGSRKYFQASRMRVIDFTQKITPIGIIFRIFENKFRVEKNMKKSPKFRFFSIHPIISICILRWMRLDVSNPSDFSRFQGKTEGATTSNGQRRYSR